MLAQQVLSPCLLPQDFLYVTFLSISHRIMDLQRASPSSAEDCRIPPSAAVLSTVLMGRGCILFCCLGQVVSPCRHNKAPSAQHE